MARKKKWPLYVAAGLILVGVWGLRKHQEGKLYREKAAEAARVANQAPQVKTYRVRAQDISGALKRIGTIRARAETNLQFGAPGRVAKFDIEKGRFVKKGVLIVALDQAEVQNMLQAAQLEFEKASMKYFKDRTIDRLDFERIKARYTQARLEAAKTSIRAPHDGYLVEKWINAGEQVEGGTVIGKLMDKSSVYVEMDLSENDIQYLKTGQKVEVTVDAVPDYKQEGKVTAISPYLKGDTRSFNVRVDLAQAAGEALNPGMFARCTIRRYEKAKALVIPLEASAGLEEKNIKIFLVDEQNKVQGRKVSIIFMDEGRAEVDGVKEGEIVVLHPGADLQDGSAVRVMDVFDPAAVKEAPAGSTKTVSGNPS